MQNITYNEIINYTAFQAALGPVMGGEKVRLYYGEEKDTQSKWLRILTKYHEQNKDEESYRLYTCIYNLEALTRKDYEKLDQIMASIAPLEQN